MAASNRVDVAFADGLVRWGHRPALQSGERVVSYLDLDRRARELATLLLEHGVRRGDVVAVATGDIIDWACGLLAAWRAGAAALPLDARYPVSRLTGILGDASARVVLAENGFPADVVPAGMPLLRPFAGLDTARVPSVQLLPHHGLDADEIAYLCYTSGSTGKPKGIRVPHRGVPLLARDRRLLPIEPEDRMAQCCNFAFDVSQYELWSTLLNGACLVAVPRPLLSSPAEFARFLADQRITTMCPTTALFNAVSLARPDAFGGVKSVLIAGEAADAQALGRVLRSRRPPQRVVNAYGPTETTIYAAWHEVSLADVDAGVIPIGRATQGMRLHVLDAAGAEVADGEVGELHIAGPGVSAGYVNLPEMTAQRFVALPLRLTEGGDGRAYRSGDLCRRRADGTLEYLGRADDQLKINGYRIEPAEVAAALCRLDQVRDAVVLGRPTPFGTKELVAVVMSERPVVEAQLRDAVAAFLPRYLVPAAVRGVDSFPLTPAGKVDRAALLALFTAPVAAAAAAAPAEDSIEARLGELWCRLAQAEQADLDDPQALQDVDSMALMHLAIEVETRFGVELGVADVAPGTTLRQLAALIAGRSTAPASRPAQASTPRPASDAGQPTVLTLAYPWRLWRWPEEIPQALSTDRGNWHQLDVPVQLLARPGRLRVEDMAQALFEQIEERGLAGPYVLCGHSFCATLALELAQLLTRAGHEVSCLVMLDARFPRRRSRKEKLAFLAQRAWAIAAQGHAAIARSTRWYASWVRKRLSSSIGIATDDLFFRCRDAMMRYQPSPYAGRVLSFSAETFVDSRHFETTAARPDVFVGDFHDEVIACEHIEMIESAEQRVFIADRIQHLLGRAGRLASRRP